MRTCLLTAAALLLAAGAGCNSMNFARRGDDGAGLATSQSAVVQASAAAEAGGVVNAHHYAADGEVGQIAQVGHHGACGCAACAGCATATPSCAAGPGCGPHGACGCGPGYDPYAIRGGLLVGCRNGLLDRSFAHSCGPHGCGLLGRGGLGRGGMGHVPFGHNGGSYGPHGGAHGTPGYPHAHHREYVGPQGPPTAQVAYPYYTIRGPRDFLLNNPPTIGR